MDKQRIASFADIAYRDVAGAMTIGLAYVGLRTGLFAALAKSGPVAAPALAEQSGLTLRYVEEWLNGMAAAQWLEYDEATDTFTLPEEHAFLLDSEGTDHYMGGLFIACQSLTKLAPQIVDAFHNGGGVPFDAFGPEWVEAVDLLNSGAYANRLASYWIPQMPDVAARLEAGGRAFDLGCGVGRAAMALGAAYPSANILGVDMDATSIAQARDAATQAGLSHVEFFEGSIGDVSKGDGYDLATLFDCLHDLTEPVETLGEIRSLLKPDGALFIMEPKAADRLQDNINSLGAIYYGFSVFHCITQSLAQGGPGLGTCLGPARTLELLREGGFSQAEELPIKSQTNAFFVARP